MMEGWIVGVPGDIFPVFQPSNIPTGVNFNALCKFTITINFIKLIWSPDAI